MCVIYLVRLVEFEPSVSFVVVSFFVCVPRARNWYVIFSDHARVNNSAKHAKIMQRVFFTHFWLLYHYILHARIFPGDSLGIVELNE